MCVNVNTRPDPTNLRENQNQIWGLPDFHILNWYLLNGSIIFTDGILKLKLEGIAPAKKTVLSPKERLISFI